MANAKNRKVIKYKKRLNINIGVIIFGITFIYIFMNVCVYFSKDKITFYEVLEGSTTAGNTSTYTGIALRNETVAYAKTSGYINYYVREGNRVSKNSTLYSMDESGEVSRILSEAAEESSQLSKEDIKALQTELLDFSSDYNAMEFDKVYDFKYNLDSRILELINSNSLNSINKILAESGKEGQYEINRAETTGIVVYSVDDFEQKKAEDIKKSDFDTENYKKAVFSSNTLVEADTPIYKTISDETWSIVVPLSNADILKYADTTSVKVKFVKDNLETQADFQLVFNESEEGFGKLTFHNYMVRYATLRFIDVQLDTENVSGLKVPKSAIVEKDFYVIPKAYGSQGGDTNNIGFYKQTYLEDGTASVTYIEPVIYDSTEDFYFVDMDTFKKGDILVKNDSTERCSINATQKLLGVYNINNGYTVFRQVRILADSSDYYIVESGTEYGLVVYDHIVLDASAVSENQIIFQ